MNHPMKAAGEALPDVKSLSTDQLIAKFGGEMRALVEALVAANAVLEDELWRTQAVVSKGYSRGWHHRDREQVQW